MEGPVHGKRGHVVGKVECVGHVGGVEDEVEGEGVGFEPVFVSGADELLGAELEGVVFFIRGVGDGVDFCAESLGPEEAEMAQAAAAVILSV